MKYMKYVFAIIFGIAITIVGERSIKNHLFSGYSTSTVVSISENNADFPTLESASVYPDPFTYQSRASFCGVASVSNVLASYNMVAPSQDEMLKNEEFKTSYWDVLVSGLTLEQLSELIESQGEFSTKIERPDTIEEMHEVLTVLDDPNARLIINYSRMPLFGKNIGHHTPVGGYDKNTGRVLLLDVNEDYGNYIVEPETLFVSIKTQDSETGNQRGFLVIKKI